MNMLVRGRVEELFRMVVGGGDQLYCGGAVEPGL